MQHAGERLQVPVQEPDRNLHVHLSTWLPENRDGGRVQGYQRVRDQLRPVSARWPLRQSRGQLSVPLLRRLRAEPGRKVVYRYGGEEEEISSLDDRCRIIRSRGPRIGTASHLFFISFLRSESRLLLPANDRRQMHRQDLGATHGHEGGLLLHHGSGMGPPLRDLSVQRFRQLQRALPRQRLLRGRTRYFFSLIISALFTTLLDRCRGRQREGERERDCYRSKIFRHRRVQDNT